MQIDSVVDGFAKSWPTREPADLKEDILNPVQGSSHVGVCIASQATSHGRMQFACGQNSLDEGHPCSGKEAVAPGVLTKYFNPRFFGGHVRSRPFQPTFI